MEELPFVKPKKENSLIYSDLLVKLLKEGSVETNSPKNRKKLYKYLKDANIDYMTEIVGYSADSSSHNGLIYWNKGKIGMVAKLIAQKRILYKDLSDSYGETKVKLLPAFQQGLQPYEIYEIIEKSLGYDLDAKYNIFTASACRKTIKRITIKVKIP